MRSPAAAKARLSGSAESTAVCAATMKRSKSVLGKVTPEAARPARMRGPNATELLSSWAMPPPGTLSTERETFGSRATKPVPTMPPSDWPTKATLLASKSPPGTPS